MKHHDKNYSRAGCIDAKQRAPRQFMSRVLDQDDVTSGVEEMTAQIVPKILAAQLKALNRLRKPQNKADPTLRRVDGSTSTMRLRDRLSDGKT